MVNYDQVGQAALCVEEILLQIEVENFILRMAAEFPQRKEQLVFLINNYDMLLAVLSVNHCLYICYNNLSFDFRSALQKSLKNLKASRHCCMHEFRNLWRKSCHLTLEEW